MARADETRLNLNGANEHELMQLPRVGVDKARRIVRHRAIRQGSRDWADLACTPGITGADVEAMRSRAWIGPPAQEVLAGSSRRRTARGPATARRPRKPVP
jgi:hypothetical protein